MALVQIPIDNNKGNQVLSVQLDGTRYRLKILWNSRGLYWTLEIQTADGTPIVSGIRIVANYSLLSRYTSIDLPPGKLYCLDAEKTGNEPGATTFGIDFIMNYDEA